MLKNIYQYDFRMLRIVKFICSATESHEYYTYEYSQRHSPTPQPPPPPPPQKKEPTFFIWLNWSIISRYTHKHLVKLIASYEERLIIFPSVNLLQACLYSIFYNLTGKIKLLPASNHERAFSHRSNVSLWRQMFYFLLRRDKRSCVGLERKKIRLENTQTCLMRSSNGAKNHARFNSHFQLR